MFTREWVLIIERASTIKVRFMQPEIENGYLKIKWQKFERPYFQSYKIIVTDSCLGHSFSKIFFDAGSNSLIDSSFVGGSVRFDLEITIKDCGGSPVKYISDKLVYRYSASVNLRESLDTLEINWTKIPFRHTVSLNYFSKTIELDTARSYKMIAPGLGNQIRYMISFKPTVKLTWDHQKYNIYEDHTIGTSSDMKFYRMVYLPEKNIFLLKYPMFFRKYSGTTITRLGTYDYSWDYNDGATIAASPDMSSLFTTSDQNITSFSTATFQIISRQKFGPSESGSRTFQLMHILNDSLMYIGYNSTLSIYNYQARKENFKISLSYSNGDPYNTSITKDGKYIANCSNTDLRVFRLENDTLTQIYAQTGDFYQCIFDPVNTGNLLIVTPTGTYVVHCPDMATLCVFPAGIRGMAVNFDPVTNDLLLVSSVAKTLTIYDYLNNVVKFRYMHHGTYKEFYLAYGTVFHNSGYYLDKNYDFFKE